MSIDHNYARGKLKLLLRDLSNYNAGEFWREMSRIASGATTSIHAEGLKAERDALADSNTQLMQQNEAQIKMNAKLMHERDAMAAHVERLIELGSAADMCAFGITEEALAWADACEDAPKVSLARHDANILREYADKLEADEAPDAEAGDMWDASQCADWMREQADKAEGQQ